MPIANDTPRGQNLIELPASVAEDRRQWVHLMPAGLVKPRDGREPWHNDDCEAVVAETNVYANGAPLLVDYEHQAETASKKQGPVPAAGWIVRVEARPDGIWGLVEWTRHAAELINQRQYRFLSPVFAHDKPTRNVRAILRAALTNTPALTLTALAKEELSNMTPIEQLLALLRAALDLGEDAGSKEIISAISSLKDAVDNPAPDRFAPVEALSAVTNELNKLRKGVAQEQAEATVNGAIQSGKMPPALRDWAVELCKLNKPAFDDFISRTGGSFAYLRAKIIPDGAPPPSFVPRSLPETDIARRVGLSAEDVRTYGKSVA